MNSDASKSSNMFQRQQNGRICKCNLTAVIRVSNTSKNPGRLFYGCPKLKVADRCNFFLWLDNECVGDGCISEATSRLGFTASSNDEDWKKSVAKRLKHVESEIRRIRWTMMVLCVVLGFVMGILWEK